MSLGEELDQRRSVPITNDHFILADIILSIEVEVQDLQANEYRIHSSQVVQSEASITHKQEPTENPMPLEYVAPELKLPPSESFREHIEVLQRIPQTPTSLSEVFAGELHKESGLLKVAVKANSEPFPISETTSIFP